MNIHQSGQIIGGRYEIIQFIDEGGMQEVYKAYDALLAREVALKTPKTRSATKRFRRSAETSAKINHANVAKTLDYLAEGDRQYLIEELIVGINLGQFLRFHVESLDPQICAYTLHHLAKGLAASHHAGVVHRDLKPTNVMVVGGPDFRELKITDFGIAKMAQVEIDAAVQGNDPQALTQSATALGALPYMSPEMIRSIDVDKPSDVWSLGAMAYELLTGQTPFGTGYVAVPLIQEAKLPPFPRASFGKMQFQALAKEIYDVISSCIKLNPLDRPSADQVIQACEKLCYSYNSREFINVDKLIYNGQSGWLGSGDDQVFFHMDSVPNGTVKAGDRVWIARHAGSPRQRAFPVVPARPSRGASK